MCVAAIEILYLSFPTQPASCPKLPRSSLNHPTAALPAPAGHLWAAVVPKGPPSIHAGSPMMHNSSMSFECHWSRIYGAWLRNLPPSALIKIGLKMTYYHLSQLPAKISATMIYEPQGTMMLLSFRTWIVQVSFAYWKPTHIKSLFPPPVCRLSEKQSRGKALHQNWLPAPAPYPLKQHY